MSEEPAWYMTPRDAALLIDRLLVISDRPSTISEGITCASEAITVAALTRIEELTRGMVEPAPQASPIPRSPRRLDD